ARESAAPRSREVGESAVTAEAVTSSVSVRPRSGSTIRSLCAQGTVTGSKPDNDAVTRLAGAQAPRANRPSAAVVVSRTTRLPSTSWTVTPGRGEEVGSTTIPRASSAAAGATEAATTSTVRAARRAALVAACRRNGQGVAVTISIIDVNAVELGRKL